MEGDEAELREVVDAFAMAGRTDEVLRVGLR